MMGRRNSGEPSPAHLQRIGIARRGTVNGLTVLPPSFAHNSDAVGTVHYPPAVQEVFLVPIPLVPTLLLALPLVFLRASVHPLPFSRDGAVGAVQNPVTFPATFPPCPFVLLGAILSGAIFLGAVIPDGAVVAVRSPLAMPLPILIAPNVLRGSVRVVPSPFASDLAIDESALVGPGNDGFWNLFIVVCTLAGSTPSSC